MTRTSADKVDRAAKVKDEDRTVGQLGVFGANERLRRQHPGKDESRLTMPSGQSAQVAPGAAELPGMQPKARLQVIGCGRLKIIQNLLGNTRSQAIARANQRGQAEFGNSVFARNL